MFDDQIPLTRREASKRETRNRVLAAARELFAELGYAATTIRLIAERAGVAPGSVFTTFESKEDILSVIVLEKYDELTAILNRIRAEPHAGPRARLKACYRAGYAFEFQRLPLIVEQIGASWTWSRAFEARSQAGLVQPFGFVLEEVRAAMAAGELRADLEEALFCDLLIGAYLRNFRHAWFRTLSAEQVADMADRQIDLLFDGGRP